MQRKALSFLNNWYSSSTRSPLIIRGARQVGKTWIVRQFAEDKKLNLIELNFETKPQYKTFFTSNEPAKILLELSSSFKRDIDPKNTLLFLDEIQAAPDIFPKLRWFAEDMPELAVVAAGSLLEFLLESHNFSMPVGRISYMHMEPLSFEEFINANGYTQLTKYMSQYEWGQDIPLALHEQILDLFKEYIIIGGMPKAVYNWTQNRSVVAVNEIHHNLINTYRDDFPRYSKGTALEGLDDVFMAVPLFIGKKFVYSKINTTLSTYTVKKAFDLLCKARVSHKVQGSMANGVPLAAEIQDKYLKAIFIDVGLCSAALGLSLDAITNVKEISLINSGGIAEQVAGQLLRTINPFYIEPALYYWHRTEKGSEAELDYVIQHKNTVVPVEVKAGSTGTMKSLHLFMGLKRFNKAVRIYSGLPLISEIPYADKKGKDGAFTLYSLPFYLMSELHRLLE